MSKDDGHGPATCNYNECKADSNEPCPFVKDQKPSRDLHDLNGFATKAELFDELRDVLRKILDHDSRT